MGVSKTQIKGGLNRKFPQRIIIPAKTKETIANHFQGWYPNPIDRVRVGESFIKWVFRSPEIRIAAVNNYYRKTSDPGASVALARIKEELKKRKRK